MNVLLLFFSLPIATIILAIALQKILKCPFLVASVFFAIFLVVAFAVFDACFLVFVVIYTILAFISALLTKLITNFMDNDDNDDNDEDCGHCECNNLRSTNIVRNSGNCNCRRCR